MAVDQYLDFSAKGNSVEYINTLMGSRVAVCQAILFPHMDHKLLKAEAVILGFKAAYES